MTWVKPTAHTWAKGLGWHPAIEIAGNTFFWPNITYPSEYEAKERAKLALKDSGIESWNVVRLGRKED